LLTGPATTGTESRAMTTSATADNADRRGSEVTERYNCRG